MKVFEWAGLVITVLALVRVFWVFALRRRPERADVDQTRRLAVLDIVFRVIAAVAAAVFLVAIVKGW